MTLVGLKAPSKCCSEHSFRRGLAKKPLREAELLADRLLEDNERAEQMARSG